MMLNIISHIGSTHTQLQTPAYKELNWFKMVFDITSDRIGTMKAISIVKYIWAPTTIIKINIVSCH